MSQGQAALEQALFAYGRAVWPLDPDRYARTPRGVAMTGRCENGWRFDVEYLDELAADLRAGLDFALTPEGGLSLDFLEGTERILAVAERLNRLTLDGSLPDDRRLTVVRDVLDAVDHDLRRARASFEDGEEARAAWMFRAGPLAAVERAIGHLRGAPLPDDPPEDPPALPAKGGGELRQAAVRLSASHTRGSGAADAPEVRALGARADAHGLALVGIAELAQLRRVLYWGDR